MMKFHLLVFIFLIHSIVFTQKNNNWLAFKNNESTHTIKINKHSKIESLIKKIGEPLHSENSVKLEGYRVQVYFDKIKNKCYDAKLKFLSVTENTKTYIQYVAPHYRLRVGNYRSKLEAENFRNLISVYFPESIVVKDSIDLPKLD